MAISGRTSTLLVDERKLNGKRGALAGLALDHQPSAMAVEDVLDQSKPKTGAAFGPALRDIDAVEAFGQARNVLGRDPRAVIAHRHEDRRSTVGSCRRRETDLDALAAGAVFQRILDQILEHAGKLVAIAGHD